MIGSLEGKITLAGPGYVILETAGVGYKVFVTAAGWSTLSGLVHLAAKPLSEKKTVKLWIHHAVREDADDFFGFLEKEELDFFELLLKVPTIGPKSALGILSLTTLSDLKQAIAAGDTSYLTKVHGIGKKTAEKVVFALRDEVEIDAGGKGSKILREESDALEALRSLGYETRDAREALKKVPSDIIGLNDKVKEALRILGNNGA